ncbi:SusE domain-containing protein [Solitalea sp. MAHUQ-68]|uniref:SusE domain-containing protein n=1 Tax=Solitalea agri TaxID=2953739 RepID=A0A9X2EYU6_9SPHI|nr:SusE domain-containing protein [Solitalea agri]MCO4291447.1 SusE domain-containing protein [Solitalea agri]
MKKQFYTLLLLSIALFSCQKEEAVGPMIAEDIKAPVITNPSVGSVVEITETNLTDTVKIKWQQADYGVTTAVSYNVEADLASRQFSQPISIGSSNSGQLAIVMSDLNKKLLDQLHLPENQASEIELRIGASINNQKSVISQIVKLTVTPFKAIVEEPPIPEPVRLWVPGGYQGYKPDQAPKMTDIGDGKFEGYVYISSGTDLKFTSAPDWNHINYGYASDGKLTTDGGAGSMSVDKAGVYKLEANINDLTYKITLISTWGVIGTATPSNWDASTPMTYNVNKDEWSVKLNLKAGALKFRANDGWDINFGPAASGDLVGELIQTNDAISIPEDGNYTVTISLSKANAPYKYSYTVLKN